MALNGDGYIPRPNMIIFIHLSRPLLLESGRDPARVWNFSFRGFSETLRGSGFIASEGLARVSEF